MNIKTRWLLCLLIPLFTAPCGSVADTANDPQIVLHKKSELEPKQTLVDLKVQSETAIDKRKEAQLLEKKALSEVKRAISPVEKELSELLVQLQQYRGQLTQIQVETLARQESEVNSIAILSEQLKHIEVFNKSGGSPYRIEQLEEVSKIWRLVVDKNVHSLFDFNKESLPEPPKIMFYDSLFEKNEVDLQSKAIELKKICVDEKESLERTLNLNGQKKKDLNSRLLLKAGRVRALVMNQLVQNGRFSVWTFNPDYLKDYIREVQVVPYRLIAGLIEKYFDYKSLSSKGIKGYLQIAKQLAILLFVLCLPFLFFKLFHNFSDYLDSLRKNIFTRSQIGFQNRTRIALWIGRLNPYLPWVFAFITVELASYLLLNTLLGPLSLFLPYLKAYIVFRAMAILFSSLLARVLISKELDQMRLKKPLVRATSKKLSLVFFAQWMVLLVTEDMVRKALIYNFVSDMFLAVNFLFIALEAKKWESDILRDSSNWLNKKISHWLASAPPSLRFFANPVLFVGNSIFILFGWFYQWFSQFEVGKKLSSELFKKKLVGVSEKSKMIPGQIDDQYKNYFTLSNYNSERHKVTLDRSPFMGCIDIINQWKNETHYQDLLLLYGNLGIGKSTQVRAIHEHFATSLNCKLLTIDDKISQSDTLMKLLSQALGIDINASNIEEIDKGLPKTLIIIDNIHNLYLNTYDGLEAYRTLIDLTSLHLENIFWCLTSNERALAHLNGLFGPHHFVGKEIELHSWTDSEIQDLILKRHADSQLALSFDPVISAIHKGDVLEASSSLEMQFFRLLWGQSRGNPSTAQELWLSAAHRHHDGSIRISIPEFISPKALTELDDDALMAYSTIVKHESLSFSELQQVCPLPSPVLRQALKFGEDSLILEKVVNSRWRVLPRAQYVVHAQLKGRNLIYG